VHVRRQVRIVGGALVFAQPKGAKTRDVPLAESVALRLAAHLQRFPAQPVTLPWREPDGKPTTAALVLAAETGALDRNTYNDAWRAARKRAGIPAGRENGLHALRHFYASQLLQQGVNIRAVSEYLGHTDPGFTLRVYGHLMPAAHDQARRAVDLALAGSPDVAPAASADA
jgi:integrase